MAKDLEIEILAYLVAHPAALDGPDGIRVWWLPGHVEASVIEVEEALSRLVARGWLEERGNQHARVYGVSAGALESIAAHVKARRHG